MRGRRMQRRDAGRQRARGGGPAPPLRAVASVDQLMDAIIIPSSQRVFDAVVYVNGQLEQSPKSDDDWFQIQMSALAVAEAGNLLMLPPRAKDGGEWRLSRARSPTAPTAWRRPPRRRIWTWCCRPAARCITLAPRATRVPDDARAVVRASSAAASTDCR